VTCEELHGRLTDYAEGALDAETCAALEAHLAGCPACAALRQDLADLSRLCRQEPPSLMPPDVRARLEVLLAGDASAPPPSRRRP
jgi:anti-sigma factor RsiW